MFRLLELLGGLSATLDLGTGSTLDESLCRSTLAVRLARAAGLDDEGVREVLYASLLEHLGCTAYAHELGEVFGDDVAAIRAGFRADWTDRLDLFRVFVPDVARASGRSRIRTLSAAVVRGPITDRDGPAATCEVAQRAAGRLGLTTGVQTALGHVRSMWNGGGHPGVAGDEVPQATRILHVASVATLFGMLVGPDRGVAEVRRRGGSYLDPALVELVEREMLEGIGETDAYDELLALEPGPVLMVDRDGLPSMAAVFGDLVDLKSPWLHGHSRGVAELAAGASAVLGLPANDVWTLRVAGHLHDLGRVGVSSAVWDKERPLTTSERAQVQLHPWHTEQILNRVAVLRPVAEVAGQHHERLDGSGYHRRPAATAMSTSARVLAAADRYRCLVEGRPHRSALRGDEARSLVTADVRAGRLDGDAVAAVLDAAGHRRRSAPPRPAGLTPRQLDVLRLLADGCTNKEIAARLVISPRTAEHHVQDIYTRTATSTRAGAAMFAMEHGLLAPDGRRHGR